MCESYKYYINTHTSKSTANNICMPSSNKAIRCCHTNIVSSSFNGAFSLYNTYNLREFIVKPNKKLLLNK